MSDTIINISLTIVFILVIALIAMMGQKFPLFGKVLSLLKILFIVTFFIVLTGLAIFAYSFLGAIVIGTDLFLLPEDNFLYAGEPVNPLLNEIPLIKFALTFGIFYFVSYIGSTTLYSFLNMNVWISKALVFITTSLLIVYVYPIVMQTIFPKAYVSFKGALLLVTTVVIIIIKQIIKKEAKEMERFSNTRQYVFRRIVPWLKTGKQPD